jgi:hypothetical protein
MVPLSKSISVFSSLLERKDLQPIIAPTTQVNGVFEARQLSITQVGAVQHAERVEQEDKRQQAVVKFTEDGVFFCLRYDLERMLDKANRGVR